jgi:poly(hydroxyalkanoate) depolymerase family esterase
MFPSLRGLMSEATRLTRAGDLRAAMATIRSALAARSPLADVESVARQFPSSADIIDVEALEVEASVPTAPPATGAFIQGSYTCADGARDYKLFVPPGADGRPLPLIVMLHGCTQGPDDFARGTGMNDVALERGFYVLYPAQSQRVNPQRCWNWFKPRHQGRGQGEPALLAGMTREVMKHHDVDERRVYVAGLSAGGAMAAILGEAYPDLFAAVGVHSGLPIGAATDVGSALGAMKHGATIPGTSSGKSPVIVFHGDRDATVHPLNGEQIIAARTTARTPEVERGRSASGCEYTRRIYRDDDQRVVAEHWLIHGAAHAWSGGSSLGSYTDARGPDATEELIRFLFANTRSTVM